MSEPLRIALIGAGVMGRQHCQQLEGLAEARLCAVADPGPQAAAFASECGVPHFADHRQMLAEARPQAAIVANSNNLHVGTALDCIAAGVPVLVGHHRRHNPLIARARELVRSGSLGRLTTVTALWQLQKPDSYFDIPWCREPGAGMLLTNLIHDLDLLRHLCGEVSEVQAITGNGVRGFANEDSAVVLLRFANGALGTLTGSDAVAAPWSWELDSGENPVYPRQADQPCYLLVGTRGALSIPQLRRWHYAEPGAGWHQPLLQNLESFQPGEALRLQLQHFVKVARGEVAPLVDVVDAGNTLALLEAIREAAETGRACSPHVISAS